MTDEAFAALMEETSPGYAKREGLRVAAQDKRQNLGRRDNTLLPVSQGESFGLGTTSNINGQIVQNKNKLYNENTGAQQQQALSDAYDQRIYTDGQGRKYQLPGSDGKRQYLTDQNMDTTHLYGGKSKTNPNIDKFGIAELGVEPRYTPGMVSNYGWESGKEGIDPKTAYMNWEMPQATGERMEGLIHGNTGNIGSRTMFDDGTTAMQAKRVGLGSGASEYYDSKTMPLMNAKTENIRKGLSPDMPKGQAPTKDEKMLHDIFGTTTGEDTGDGRQWSNIKSIAAGGANIVKNLMDLGAEGAAAAGEMTGLMDSQWAQKTRDYHNSTLEDWQKKFGVNTKHSQTASKELSTAVEDGRYLDAFTSVIGNLDVHLSNSAPEMIALSAKLPGLAISVNSRVKEQSAAFKAKEGREPTNAEVGMMVVTNTAVLGAEQLVLIGPLKDVFRAATKSGRTVGKTSRDKVMSVIGATVGEAGQEALDQAQEQYWTKGGSGDKEGTAAFTEAGKKLAAGEVITPNEAIAASIAGAGMGGALKTAAETVSAPKDFINASKSQQERDAGEYLVGEEKKLGEAFDEMSHAQVQEGKADAVGAAKEMETMTSIEEGLQSKNPLIRRNAEQFIKETNDVEVKDGSDRHIDNIGLFIRDAVLEKDNADAQGLVATMQDKLGVDVTKSTAEEIANAVYELDTDARKEITDGLPTDLTNRTSDQKIDEKGGFDSFKEQLGQIVDLQNKTADVKIKEWEIGGANVAEGAKKAPTELKPGKVNVKKVAKDTGRGVIGTLIDVATLKNRGGIAARKELNKYTDEALAEAYTNPDTTHNLKNYIKQVQDKRKTAKKLSEIDTGSYGPRELKNQLQKGDRKSYIDAIKKGLAPKSYDDKRDVTAMRGIINTALESEFITERQAEIFNKRLDKTRVTAREPSEAELKSEKETEEKLSNEKGFGEKTLENMKSAEISRTDLEQEEAELIKTKEALQNSPEGDEFERIGKIPEADQTTEEKKTFADMNSKLESMLGRLTDVRAKMKNYSQQEINMNDAHSSMDEEWFFEGAQEVSASEAFSREEKDILGIC